MDDSQTNFVHPIAGQTIQLLKHPADGPPTIDAAAIQKIETLLMKSIQKGEGEAAIVEISKLAQFLKETYQAQAVHSALLKLADQAIRKNNLVPAGSQAFETDKIDKNRRDQEYERLLGRERAKQAPQFGEKKPEGTLRVDQLNTKFRRL
jgi:hypothetical protein